MKLGSYHWKGYLIALALLLVPLVAAACSDEEKPTIKLADTQFESLWINNAVAKFVIESAYGYPVETVEMTTVIFQATLAAGEIDLMLEGWEQNMPDWYSEEIDNGNIENLGPIYEGGPQFFVIPTWVHDQHGINTVADMKDKWELFKDPEDGSKGLFINCIIGWQCAEINTVKLEAYGLDASYNIMSPGSAAALDAGLAGAQKKSEPVFGYYWAPTALIGAYDWYILEEPEYNDACWADITAAREDKSLRPIGAACAYETLPTNSLAWSGLKDKAPEVHELINNMNMGVDALNKTAAWSQDNNVQDYQDAAVYFLENFEDKWTSWMSSGDTKKVKDALSEL